MRSKALAEPNMVVTMRVCESPPTRLGRQVIERSATFSDNVLSLCVIFILPSRERSRATVPVFPGGLIQSHTLGVEPGFRFRIVLRGAEGQKDADASRWRALIRPSNFDLDRARRTHELGKLASRTEARLSWMMTGRARESLINDQGQLINHDG